MISEDFRHEVLTRKLKKFGMIVLSKHGFKNVKSKFAFL